MSSPPPPPPVDPPEPTRIAPQRRPPESPYTGPPPPSQPWSPAGAPPPPPPAPAPPAYQPNAYGAPVDAYGQVPAYGAVPANAQGGYGVFGTPAYAYASWGKRVLGYLVDGLLMLLAGSPALVGYVLIIASFHTETGPDGYSTVDTNVGPLPFVLIAVGALLYVAVYIWNSCIRQGRTGYSLGKSVMKIQLVKEATGEPIGAGMAFVRQLLHVLDGFCYIGFLWPLWDDKRQTFADKVATTVVVERPPVS